MSVQDARQSVTAAPEVAEAPGAARLPLTRVVRDEDGRGVEYLSLLYRPDFFCWR